MMVVLEILWWCMYIAVSAFMGTWFYTKMIWGMRGYYTAFQPYAYLLGTIVAVVCVSLGFYAIGRAMQ